MRSAIFPQMRTTVPIQKSIFSVVVENKRIFFVAAGIAAVWYLFVKIKWNNLYKSMSITSLTTLEEEYDYIVVGAGSAGCLLARRLADLKFKVLLIEAGNCDINSANVRAHGFFGSLWGIFDYPFRTVAQANLKDRKISIHRAFGWVLGS